jgi:hypothetical protein
MKVETPGCPCGPLSHESSYTVRQTIFVAALVRAQIPRIAMGCPTYRNDLEELRDDYAA